MGPQALPALKVPLVPKACRVIRVHGSRGFEVLGSQRQWSG